MSDASGVGDPETSFGPITSCVGVGVMVIGFSRSSLVSLATKGLFKKLKGKVNKTPSKPKENPKKDKMRCLMSIP
jgi:hypothetical protein